MKVLLFIILTITMTACLQAENSSSLDPGTYADVDPLFGEVKNMLNQNCTSCHGYQAMTEDDFIDVGLIIPGDYINSPLYYRLSNSEGTHGPKNMPLGSLLTIKELNAVKDWILSL